MKAGININVNYEGLVLFTVIYSNTLSGIGSDDEFEISVAGTIPESGDSVEELRLKAKAKADTLLRQLTNDPGF